MRYKSTRCWVNADRGITKNVPTSDNAIKFDSMFEAKVYCSLLHEFQASQNWDITCQYPVPLHSMNSSIRPVRSMKWKCDFALFDARDSSTIFSPPVFLVEAKGQVSQNFLFTLALLDERTLERLIVCCADNQAVKKIRRASNFDIPIVKTLKDLPHYLKVHR
ncbi:hypothetical protein [Roseofilum sp. Guam]|uniref:hypothetical protein n=1 Tax=Roseofilum sp. Guam TaxID=2821502 RepID=UPI001B28E674|nr:hypothetical protein [Roseofilum sp. Guam]MBP0031191.1 hypothetical protein [Roseofilum sp. Guam]